MIQKTAIISDIHGNSPALKEVLEDIDRLGCDQILVLGDIVNGVDPSGSLKLIRELGERAICISGNAELYLSTPDLDELPDREDPQQDNLIQLINWFRAHLTEDALSWLASLPDHYFWKGACLVHDSPLDRLFPQSWHRPDLPQKYQEWYYHARGISDELPQNDWVRLWDWMEAQDVWGIVCGHTHVPLIHELARRWIINAGSVGIPLDYDPRPDWVLVQDLPAPYGAYSPRPL